MAAPPRMFTTADIPADPGRNPLLAALHGRPKFRVAVGEHGRGLVATAPIAPKEVVASYPIDYIVGPPTFYYAWNTYANALPAEYSIEIDSAYFAAVVRAVPAAGPHHPFAQAHLLNDVKTEPGPPTRSQYATDAAARANVTLVDCGDLVVAEAARTISPGEELLVAYGWHYWVTPIQEVAPRAIARGIQQAVAAQLAGP